ncbi:MAG TPA: hypothetical protein VFY73_03215 [Ideonella sp.]|uniref:hypothetical protein n=1 Tax=Ideonella sp. TaxID=1929293 RepID=UPI002E329232|nr:hypothetical protein [Ideonella sp.]HEX5683023.1 hypothetical protein [Ideonella sp.]
MNAAAIALPKPPTPMPTTAADLPRPPARRNDEAWWVELFGWQAACDAEPTDEHLMRQASLLALLSVA